MKVLVFKNVTYLQVDKLTNMKVYRLINCNGKIKNNKGVLF